MIRWSASLFLSMLCFVGCTEDPNVDSGTETLPGTGTSSYCSFLLEMEYNLNLDPSENFIVERITPSANITQTNCPGLPTGTAEAYMRKYLTRVNDTITIGPPDGTSDDYNVDLSFDGTTLIPKVLNHCSYGNQSTEDIFQGSIDITNQTLSVSILATYQEDACSGSYDDSQLYEHHDLKGIWENCDGTEEHWVGFYSNAAVDTIDYHSGPGCSNRLMYIEKNGPMVITPSDTYPKAIDISYQNFFVYLDDTSLANDFNTLAMCGITTWTTGVDIDVSGRFCDFAAHGIRTSMTFPTEEMVYDIYSIPSNGFLHLGDRSTGDATSPENRPTSIDILTDYLLNMSFVVIPTWLNW